MIEEIADAIMKQHCQTIETLLAKLPHPREEMRLQLRSGDGLWVDIYHKDKSIGFVITELQGEVLKTYCSIDPVIYATLEEAAKAYAPPRLKRDEHGNLIDYVLQDVQMANGYIIPLSRYSPPPEAFTQHQQRKSQ